MIPNFQVFTSCGPEKEICVNNQTLKDESCLIPCTGLYADIVDDSLNEKIVKWTEDMVKGNENLVKGKFVDVL